MLPKKIYLNYVDENDEKKTWCENPVHDDPNMQSREYVDLFQVWHNIHEIPTNVNRLILFYDKYNCIRSEFIPYEVVHHLTRRMWSWYVENECFVAWAYANDLLPKKKNK